MLQSKSRKKPAGEIGELPYFMHVRLPGGPGVHIHASLAGVHSVDISAQVMKCKEMLSGCAYTLNDDGSVEIGSIADRDERHCREWAGRLSYWRGVEIAQERMASVFGRHVASRLVNDLMGATKFIGPFPDWKRGGARQYLPSRCGRAMQMPKPFIDLCREAGAITDYSSPAVARWGNLYHCICLTANYLRDARKMTDDKYAATIKGALEVLPKEWERIARQWRSEAEMRQSASDGGINMDGWHVVDLPVVRWALPPGPGKRKRTRS